MRDKKTPYAIDHNDPFFFHSSDHPGLTLVPDVFDGKNFGKLEISMKIALSAKNKSGSFSGTRLYVVKRKLSGLTQGADSISGYYTKMKILWDELASLRRFPKCTCGSVKEFIKFEDEERLVHFLMGLNEVYATVGGSILMLSPLPSVGQAYAMLLQEEKQRDIRGDSRLSSESAAMNVVTMQSTTNSEEASQDDFAGFADKTTKDLKPEKISSC